MEFDLTSIVIAGVAALIAIYATWRAERRFPNLTELTKKVQDSVAILPEIRDLISNFEEELALGKVDESEIVRYITNVLHTRYPSMDLDAIRITVRGMINTVLDKYDAP